VIRVKLGPVPVDLDGPASKGGKEIAAAVALYDDDANAEKAFPFAAYKADSVKNALNTAFAFKCAYCESVYGATQPLDVEHFRPKSGFAGANGKLVKPGYYWLAAQWHNLLPSCADCNRPRSQRLADGRVLVSGKANQFPITDEDKRARRPGEEKTEPRLLLHPALDDPRRHLEFDAEEGIVRPAVSSSGAASRKATKSIEVYALLRDGLVRARKARQILIRKEIAVARGLAKTLDENGPNATLEQLLRDSLAMLRDYMSADAPYAGMARQMIEPALAELTG
jgi:uncharacterized protein (TIGR02646 family)